MTSSSSDRVSEAPASSRRAARSSSAIRALPRERSETSSSTEADGRSPSIPSIKRASSSRRSGSRRRRSGGRAASAIAPSVSWSGWRRVSSSGWYVAMTHSRPGRETRARNAARARVPASASWRRSARRRRRSRRPASRAIARPPALALCHLGPPPRRARERTGGPRRAGGRTGARARPAAAQAGARARARARRRPLGRCPSRPRRPGGSGAQPLRPAPQARARPGPDARPAAPPRPPRRRPARRRPAPAPSAMAEF